MQLKIDSEFPRFTEGLLSVVYPHYLAPTPSMAVVKMEPNHRQGVLTDGFRVPRGSVLRGNLGRGEQTACEFRTAHDVDLWPIQLGSVSHSSFVADLGEISLPSRKIVRGAIRLRFNTVNGAPVSQLALERLPLFLRGAEQARDAHLRACPRRRHRRAGARRFGYAHRARSPTTPIRAVGFEDEEALLPYGPRSFQGYRLLHEYFALPSRFLFVELADLGPGVRACQGSELEIVIPLDRNDPSLEPLHLSRSISQLFCTPAINLFPRKTDRIHLNDRENEYHVVARSYAAPRLRGAFGERGSRLRFERQHAA